MWNHFFYEIKKIYNFEIKEITFEIVVQVQFQTLDSIFCESCVS
jgi:hypothetical protein